MPKTRLNVGTRTRLKEMAKTQVSPSALRKALDAAYDKVEPYIKAAVEAKWPAADMDVLAKYNQIETVCDPRLRLDSGAIDSFKPHVGYRVPRYTYNQIYQLDARGSAAFEKWKDAHTAYEAERQARIKAYTALIDGSTYLEEIVEVWPEAVTALPTVQNLPIRFGQDVIDTVKADVKERKRGAA